jgi:coenzyme F420-0:L-glutamate ligase/coenzyme F420-1:gamma-L-glutamate ligase
VISHKVVSKAEGRVVRLADLDPVPAAIAHAGRYGDPQKLDVVLSETRRKVRARGSLLIAETRHGFVCASAGVDDTNTEPGTVVLLPVDPDASARRIRAAIQAHSGKNVAVVVTDSFGRPFRRGNTHVAIGVAGLAPLHDLRGTTDRGGYVLRTSQVAVADELAAAADLVRTGKGEGLPAAIVRGVDASGDGTARDLVMPRERDLFR